MHLLEVNTADVRDEEGDHLGTLGQQLRFMREQVRRKMQLDCGDTKVAHLYRKSRGTFGVYPVSCSPVVMYIRPRELSDLLLS